MAINAIAKAISEGFKLVRTVLDSREIRRYKKAIDAGQNYIRCNERDGKFESMSDKRREKLLASFSAKLFKYDQG